MSLRQVTPNDSRYVPFTQQPSCCVPTCILMVMYKNDIPLIPAEELGYRLGLVIRPDRAELFYKPRTSPTPPPTGYGTRIYEAEFEPNKVFKKLGIPLTFEVKPIADITSPEALVEELAKVEKQDSDALLNFNHGALTDEDKDWGHAVVFDRIIDSRLRIIDPEKDAPKWRQVTAEKMFAAMQKHSAKSSVAGIWLLTKKNYF